MVLSLFAIVGLALAVVMNGTFGIFHKWACQPDEKNKTAALSEEVSLQQEPNRRNHSIGPFA